MTRKTVILAGTNCRRAATLTPALMSSGYSVIRVGTGKEVAEICFNSQINLVLTELLLPDMNGIRLVEQVNQVSPTTKCLLVSEVEPDLIARLPGCETLRSQFIENAGSTFSIAEQIDSVLRPRTMTAGNSMPIQ
jgi:CheY-like chemotaxis protein